MLTGRWFRCDRMQLPVWAQSLVSSFDKGEVIWCDRTLGASVRLTPVRFQRGKIVTGRVRSVLTGRYPASGHNLNTRSQGELTGASGHPTEAHNGSFFIGCINTSSIRVRGYFCSFQQLRNTF